MQSKININLHYKLKHNILVRGSKNRNGTFNIQINEKNLLQLLNPKDDMFIQMPKIGNNVFPCFLMPP